MVTRGIPSTGGNGDDDPFYHDRLQARASFLRSGAQALIVLNGGGAVALLAFLQAVWTTAPGLVHWIVGALIAQAIGVSVAAALPFLNHTISLAYEGRGRSPASPDFTEINRLERRRKHLTVLAFACFAVSLVLMILGVELSIPPVDINFDSATGA